MIVIVSGQRDSGKTTWCRENLSAESTAGVLLVKDYEESLFVGYDAVRLGTGARIPFMRIRNFAGSGGRPHLGRPHRFVDEIGQFRISEEGLSRATEWIRDSAADPSKDILVDEVGRLELEGRGFFSAVETAVEQAGPGWRRTLYLVVREIFVRDVMERFGIEQAEVMEIENGAVRSRRAVDHNERSHEPC